MILSTQEEIDMVIKASQRISILEILSKWDKMGKSILYWGTAWQRHEGLGQPGTFRALNHWRFDITWCIEIRNEEIGGNEFMKWLIPCQGIWSFYISRQMTFLRGRNTFSWSQRSCNERRKACHPRHGVIVISNSGYYF